MAALRASFSISPEILTRFNELVPPQERSRTVQNLMASILSKRHNELEAIANELETHPDFAMVRADSSVWDSTVADGLDAPSV